jgi:hypothetical protein
MENILFSNKLHPSIPMEKDVFGQFIGSWNLDLIITHSNGSKSNFNGEWHFSRILQGRAIQDIWVIPNINKEVEGEFLEYGTTTRTYNPKTGKWKACWMGPIQNQVFIFDIEDTGDTIILSELTITHFEMRWIFFEISENSFQWKSEVKYNGSDKWMINYHMKLNRIKK